MKLVIVPILLAALSGCSIVKDVQCEQMFEYIQADESFHEAMIESNYDAINANRYCIAANGSPAYCPLSSSVVTVVSNPKTDGHCKADVTNIKLIDVDGQIHNLPDYVFDFMYETFSDDSFTWTGEFI